MRLIDVDRLTEKIQENKLLAREPAAKRILEMINKSETVKAEPVKYGEWLGTVCTACGESTSFYYDCKYCPYCGAKMESEDNDL